MKADSLVLRLEMFFNKAVLESRLQKIGSIRSHLTSTGILGHN